MLTEKIGISKHADDSLESLHASQDSQTTEWHVVLKVIRPLLLIWAAAVWLFIIAIPAWKQTNDLSSALIHLPYPLIGLTFIGAMVIAYDTDSDLRMGLFLMVLLLLAGWV